jgi:hypothetical protein
VLALTDTYRPISEDIDKILLLLSQAQQVEVAAGDHPAIQLHPLRFD